MGCGFRIYLFLLGALLKYFKYLIFIFFADPGSSVEVCAREAEVDESRSVAVANSHLTFIPH